MKAFLMFSTVIVAVGSLILLWGLTLATFRSEGSDAAEGWAFASMVCSAAVILVGGLAADMWE